MKIISFFLFVLAVFAIEAHAVNVAIKKMNPSNDLPSYEALKKGVPEKKLRYPECLKRGGVMIMNPQHHERGTCVKREGAPLHKMM